MFASAGGRDRIPGCSASALHAEAPLIAPVRLQGSSRPPATWAGRDTHGSIANPDMRRGTGCRPSASTARSTGTGRYARTERRLLETPKAPGEPALDGADQVNDLLTRVAVAPCEPDQLECAHAKLALLRRGDDSCASTAP